MGFYVVASKDLRRGDIAICSKRARLLVRDNNLTPFGNFHLVLQHLKSGKVEKQIYLNFAETLQLYDFLSEHLLPKKERVMKDTFSDFQSLTLEEQADFILMQNNSDGDCNDDDDDFDYSEDNDCAD